MESSSCSLSSDNCIDINLTYRGQSKCTSVSRKDCSGLELYELVKQIFSLSADGNEIELKLILKGKRIMADNTYPFASNISKNKKIPRIMVVATKSSVLQELSTKSSDPTIRGFDLEKETIERRKTSTSQKPWGDGMAQDKDYKFCRLKACTWQSFGHRSIEEIPHDFQAMKLLEKLATDPGIVAIMKERELVVGTLGELDPIDDAIMKKKEEHSGGCLLGYNTNHGLRIDLKLRTDDLSGFRDYSELASTLIHELSHNWVGDHNLLFWSNFSQMRVEYLYTHARLRDSSLIVRGKSTAEWAGLDLEKLNNVFDFIMNELVKEMSQHGLHPTMIESPIQQRIQELEISKKSSQGQRLGELVNSGTSTPMRDLVLAAAERRAREQRKKKSDNR